MPNPTPYWVVRDAELLAQGVKNLRLNDGGLTNRVMFLPLLNEPVQIVAAPATNTEPGYWAVHDGATAYVLLDGLLTWTQAALIAAGYVGAPLDSVFEPHNFYYENAANAILDQLRLAGWVWPPQTYIGGWSLGGATGLLLPYFSRLTPPGIRNCYVHTFGQPRPGGRSIAHHIHASCTSFRWMNDNDPVCLVPPRVENFPAVTVAFGIRGALRAQYFVHPQGGVELSRNGTMRAADVPSLAIGGFKGSLAQWLVDWDTGGDIEHAISTYIERLFEAGQIAAMHGQLAVAPIEQPDRLGAKMVTTAARRYSDSIRELERKQNEPPVLIPAAEMFKVVKRSFTYFVEWQDQIVAACGSRRAARVLARRGNQFLQYLQPRAAVDQPAIAQCFARYLARASDPTTNFSPVMNTEFPQ